MVQVPVELPVPEIPFRPLEVEIRDLGRAEWSPGEDLFRPLMAEPSDPPPVEAPEGRRLPYRVIAGGDAPMDAGFFGDPEPLLTATAVARDEASWDAVRESLKILSPDSWGTFPVEADDPGPQYRAVRFSTVRPPDLSTDTILAIRTGRLGPGGIHLRFCVRSVSIRPNGSILCTYSYRRRYLPGPHYQIDTPGHWLLIAIPKTDAPIVFRRVP
jgi:hypothetical protein